MSEKLKSCPFCGGLGNLSVPEISNDTDLYTAVAYCAGDCGAEIIGRAEASSGKAVESVTEEWNRRAEPTHADVERVLRDWLTFAGDILPSDAAGYDWLNGLRKRTEAAIAAMKEQPERGGGEGNK